jgi:membrane-associated phospholipid phosphatase
MKYLTGVAHLLSTIFSPLLMATYAIILAMELSFLCFIPTSTKLMVILETFLATTAIPVIGIFLMSKLKIVSNPKLTERADRLWPYLLETICFIGMAVYLFYINAPAWLSLFLLGGAVALIVLAIVNSKWKMSGHATGMGGLSAMIFYLMLSGNSLGSLQWEFLTIIILSGAVCTSRIILERHTLGQVAAGFLNGAVWVLALPLIYQALTQL